MFAALVTALLLSTTSQQVPTDRSLAERLAREGRTVEALDLFQQIVAVAPADYEARLWIARLQLRLGRTADAEAGFRSVLHDHPSDIDARIGLAAALTRRGAWESALPILLESERDGGANAELLGAIARAYRFAGDNRLALDYYTRGKALAPADPELVDGFESTVQVYGHWVNLEGFAEAGASDTWSGSLTAAARVRPRLRIDGAARVQRRGESHDALGGGGVLWRSSRLTNLGVRVVGGSGNTSLPDLDATAAFVHYGSVVELGSSLRWFSFTDARVLAVSPLLALNTGDRWRLDARYTYSRSSFDTTGESAGDHSVLLRETWRAWRRVSVNVAYAYGIESFENLTADRLESLAATTVAAGLRIRLPSLTSVTGTWEHQWRPNDAPVDRLTLSIVQSFP